jgi:carboxyl-terminal processing protease
MTRRRIFIPTVNTEARDGIVIARINGFNSRTARHLSEQFRAAERASLIPLRGVVIDLRGNPGGLLRQAVSVADLFLRQGHIVSTRGRHPDSVHDFVARESDLAAGLPVVVVVNGKSASSAEIVAAALQDHDRAVVVGTTSFGKGTVQTVARLPNDGELTLTWSRFIAPSGYFLHGLGVVPTVCTRGVGDPRAIVATALERMEETAHTVAEWRSVAYDDRSGRDRLRALCPGSDADGDLDIEVAKMLLNDANAYRRAAAGSPAIVSTAHAR